MKNVYFVNDHDGIENAVMDINGKQYRVRSEVLILDNSNRVYVVNCNKMNQYDRMYKIPGGSITSDNSIINTAINESKEECRFLIKDVMYTNIKYINEYKYIPEWHKRILWPIGLKYSGSITFVCVARLCGHYDGYIKINDMEEEMLKGVFTNYSGLTKLHREAINRYLSYDL